MTNEEKHYLTIGLEKLLTAIAAGIKAGEVDADLLNEYAGGLYRSGGIADVGWHNDNALRVMNAINDIAFMPST